MNPKEILSALNRFVNQEEVLQVLSYIEELRQQNQDLRERNLQLQEQMLEYKKELDETREWEQLRGTVEEYQTSEGAVVYRAKDAKPFERFFCPGCFSDKKLVYLQEYGNGSYKQCPKCKETYLFKEVKLPRQVEDSSY